MPQAIYEFYAELQDYKPKIWRRFQTGNGVSMAKLGYMLMSMFEMQAQHLFCFDVPLLDNVKRTLKRDYPTVVLDESLLEELDEKYHIEIISDDDDFSFLSPRTTLLDALQVKIKDIIHECKSHMVFCYDYGDGWEIKLVLEKIIVDKQLPANLFPRVLAGDGFGIIENCGGVSSLADLARAYKRKSGRSYNQYREWFGIDDLDLEHFDIDDCNFRLKKLVRIFASVYEQGVEPSKQSMNFLDRSYAKKKLIHTTRFV